MNKKNVFVFIATFLILYIISFLSQAFLERVYTTAEGKIELMPPNALASFVSKVTAFPLFYILPEHFYAEYFLSISTINILFLSLVITLVVNRISLKS